MIGQSSLEGPLGHQHALLGLWKAASAGRLPHALVLRGASGIGKYQAARWLGLGLLCERGPGEPCTHCGACRRVLAGSHADFFEVDHAAAGQNAISVHFVATRENRPKAAYQGQSIEDFLRLRADGGGWRVVCVRDADAMNASAQNAFLKTLEEPGENVLIVLTSSRPDAMLETIASRTVGVDLEPLSLSQTEHVLEGLASTCESLTDGETRQVLARMAQGAPGKAVALARNAGVAMRTVLLDVLIGVLNPAEAAEGVWELDGEFSGGTPAAVRRSRVTATIDLGLELLLDQVRLDAGVAAAELAHGDVLESMGSGPSRMSSGPRFENAIEGLLGGRQDLALNLGAETVLETALRSLGGLLHSHPAGMS